MGVFLPRAEQEHRAGGTFSWNTAVDYRRQLETSGQAEFVGRAYRQAGLNLDADLSALAQAPRVAAAPAAVEYMARYYIATASP
jgi:hypothetical protein